MGRRKTIVARCSHCFNTIANEYPQLGGNDEVVHHTQLLARLVEQGKITPVNAVEEKITYHDPCFLGRHNKVFTPPREIMETVPGVQAQEMHRCKNRGFCCGAGGARMWMEERIGKRINTERIDEALGTDPDTISTACPTAWSCWATPSPRRKPAAKPKTPSKSWTSPRSWSGPCSRPRRRPPPHRPPPPARRARRASPPADRPGEGREAMDSRRTEAFSDGVFAIAITLRVLDLRLPGRGPPTPRPAQLLADWPQYFAYVVSFLTIGIMWMNHHTVLAHVSRVDRPLLVINLLLLMAVVVIPFPTSLVAEHLQVPGVASTVTYGLVLIAASLGFAGLWIYVVTHAERLGGQAQPDALRRSIPGFTGGLLVYVGATVAAAFGAPLAALVIYGLIGVYYLFEHLPSPSGPDPADWTQADWTRADWARPARTRADWARADWPGETAGQTVNGKFHDHDAAVWVGSQILTLVP